MKFLLNIILLHLSFASALAAVDPLAEWTLLSPIPTMDDLSGVVFGKGMYVAGGGVGTFLSSADGENWTMHKLPNTNAIKYTLGAITFGADQFVGVGPAGG